MINVVCSTRALTLVLVEDKPSCGAPLLEVAPSSRKVAHAI